MKRIQSLLILPMLVMGAFLLFATSCEKDEKDDDNINISGSFTDQRDGYVYKTIMIDNQEWMAENLRYLPSVNGSDQRSTTTPYYYVYGYNGTAVADAKASSNYATYGVLYNWEAASIACPVGWHLPSDVEWTNLVTFLGGETLAGNKLRESGTNHWLSPNSGATNSSGFTALPGGKLTSAGEFLEIGNSGYWWTATHTPFIAIGRNLVSSESYIYIVSNEPKESGMSVRCVKD